MARQVQSSDERDCMTKPLHEGYAEATKGHPRLSMLMLSLGSSTRPSLSKFYVINVDPHRPFGDGKMLGPFDALAPLRFHLTTMTVHPAELQTFCDTLPVSSR